MAETTKRGLGRRSFLKAAAGAAGLAIVAPQAVRGAEANSKIQLGLIGCGGRGRWIANLFAKDGNYQIVAVHDYFPDRADGAGNDHKVDAKRRHTGLGSYKDLLAGQVDAVAIISPPYFHPEHAAASVAAGKHTYVAKPIAVDVPGCHSIAASGKKATETKRVFLIDFQTRADPFYMEALKRVHAGALGTFAFGEASYHCDRIGKQGDDKTPEGRLRNWVFDKALSGDIITEQNIHTLDVMNWIMQVPPIRAWGKGGRKSRVDVGDCWDHFALVFEYPDGVGITFSSRQFDGFGSKPDGIRNRMFGVDGVLETSYGGQVLIRGKNFYRGGSSPGIYQDGAVVNIATFAESVRAGKVDNPTVAPSVQSNLVTILGRTAAYTGQVVTWDEMVKSTDKLDGRLDGLKA
ncbi:MAG TPA: Gfo/Idh/MocA family oxidoreductase [Phycisphaerae bacterium]|nr:Gfo/Idh/MocA family oxidoreductase [Phycisphaerae bacterium]